MEILLDLLQRLIDWSKKAQGTILELYPIARYSGLKVRRVCLGFSGALDRLIA